MQIYTAGKKFYPTSLGPGSNKYPEGGAVNLVCVSYQGRSIRRGAKGNNPESSKINRR